MKLRTVVRRAWLHAAVSSTFTVAAFLFPGVVSCANAGGICAPAGHVADRLLEIVTETPGTIVDVFDGTMSDEIAGKVRAGRFLVVAGSWSELEGEDDAIDRLIEYFSEHAWDDRAQYAADGPDGTQFVVVKSGVVCAVTGRWDGGDDSDSTYVPSTVYQVTIFCACD